MEISENQGSKCTYERLRRDSPGLGDIVNEVVIKETYVEVPNDLSIHILSDI